jgi:hypothetical protein
MKEKMAKAKRIPIVIGNKCFSSRKQAAEFVDVAPSTIRYRSLHKTKWLDYQYAHKGGN